MPWDVMPPAKLMTSPPLMWGIERWQIRTKCPRSKFWLVLSFMRAHPRCARCTGALLIGMMKLMRPTGSGLARTSVMDAWIWCVA